MATVAVLPVKRFDHAKQRLREGLEEGAVNELVQTMFGEVLQALGHATEVASVVVVTDEPAAKLIASEHDAVVLEDDERGHNAAASLGIERAMAMGATRALLVPGDCPLLDPQEVDELVARVASDPSVLIVPDRHGTGTNALLLTPPDAIEPSFGPGSCDRHNEIAHRVGVAAEVVHVPSLGLDVDTPDDLAHVIRTRC